MKGLEDKLFGVVGLWNIHRCTACELLWLTPYADKATTQYLYETYYTHEGLNNAFLSQQNFELFPWNKKLKYSILSEGCNYPLIIPKLYRYLGKIASKIPSLKNKAMSSIGTFPYFKHSKLLDLGCGNGDYLLEMKYLGFSVYGIEVDPNSASIARSNNLEIITGELTDNLYPENFFDAIYMNNVIEHLRNPEEVLTFCHKILKKDGLLTLKTCSNTSFAHNLYKENYRGLEVPRHFFIFSPGSLRRLAEKCGFTSTYTETSLNQYIWFSSAEIRAKNKNAAYASGNRALSLILKIVSILFLKIFPTRGDDMMLVFKK